MTKQELLSALARLFDLEERRRGINRDLRDLRGILRETAAKESARRLSNAGASMTKDVSTMRQPSAGVKKNQSRRAK